MRETSRSPIRMVPEVGVRKPAIIFSRVVLPEPEGPSRVMNSRLRTFRLIAVNGDDVVAINLGQVGQRDRDVVAGVRSGRSRASSTSL